MLAWDSDLATSSNGVTQAHQPFLRPSHRRLPAEACLHYAVLNVNLLPISVRWTAFGNHVLTNPIRLCRATMNRY